LVNPIPALTALSLGWMVMMPLLMKLAARFDGVSEPGWQLDKDGGTP